MSEKITFGELIESIAKETDHSQQFTHDFFKDFVDVIHDGLENDGKVNIAGLGKFTLKHVDEREGYNPQTEEKMTIPAHNKVVFKPYKDLRERVNAPYAHLESELLGKEQEESSSSEEKQTSPEASTKKEKTGVEQEDSESFEPETIEGNDSTEQTDEDIIEFQGSVDDNQDDFDSELEEFMGAAESGKESQSSEPLEEKIASEESDFDETEENITEKPVGDRDTQKNRTLSYAVAAGILIILALGVWYFGFQSGTQSPQMASERSASSPPTQTTQKSTSQSTKTAAADKTEQQTGQQPQQTDSQSPAAATKNNQQATSGSTKNNSSGQQTPEKEQISIDKGMTLWSLAEEKYGNPRLWPWIYDNNGRLGDPDLIIAGNSLNVPLPSGNQNTLTPSDSVGVSKGYLATYRWYKDNNPSKAKNHLWAATLYHDNIRNIAEVKIDEEDLSYAMKAR